MSNGQVTVAPGELLVSKKPSKGQEVAQEGSKERQKNSEDVDEHEGQGRKRHKQQSDKEGHLMDNSLAEKSEGSQAAARESSSVLCHAVEMPASFMYGR